MELHRNEVPSGWVWALHIRSRGTYDEHEFIEWFITPQESSAAFRDLVADHKRNGTGSVIMRWKVCLPRPRMSAEDVTAYVEDTLRTEPNGWAQLLDVSRQGA